MIGKQNVPNPIKRRMGKAMLEALLSTPRQLYSEPVQFQDAKDFIWEIEDWVFQLSRFPNERDAMMEYQFQFTRPDGSTHHAWVKSHMQALAWAKNMAEYPELAPKYQPLKLPPIPIPAGYGKW